MRRTDGWRPGSTDRPSGHGKRIDSRMLGEAHYIRLLTRAHPIVLFLDVAVLVLVFAYLLGGASPHKVLAFACSAVVLIRIIRQIRDRQHIPLNIVAKIGTVIYVVAAVTLILTTVNASNRVTALTVIVATVVHLGWSYLKWSLDKTALTHRQLWRIIGVATDDTPSMRFDSYGPTRVRRSTVSKALSGAPLLVAWAVEVARLHWLGDRLRRLSRSLEYGDFIADGPSQQDAVLGWVHAIPRPYVFKSYLSEAQTNRSSNQTEPTTQPLTPIRHPHHA